MLFRTNTGELIEIKKYNYKNDKLYYQQVMKIKNNNFNKTQINPFFAKLEKTLENKNN
jgi:hypothetical protein